MTAEEFLLKDEIATTKDLLALDKIKRDYPKLFQMILDKMEAYHKAEVEAISDEMIIKESINNSERYFEDVQYACKESHSKGARFVINKLLKQ